MPRYSPVNRMTDRCKNITLLQTSFTGGNKFYRQVSLVADTRHEQFATINFPTVNVQEGILTSAMRRRT